MSSNNEKRDPLEIIKELKDKDIENFYPVHLEIMNGINWPVQLFIFVEKNSKIYAYTTEIRETLNDASNSTDMVKISEVLKECTKEIGKKEFKKIPKKEKLSLCITRNKRKKVINKVKHLHKLIPDEIETKLKKELQNGNDKIKNVLICCKDKDINYVWEWIYWEEKDIFWGDKFNIVRIPGNCKKGENCQVKKEAIILDDVHRVEVDSLYRELKSNFEKVVKSTLVPVDEFETPPFSDTDSEKIKNCIICNMLDIKIETNNNAIENYLEDIYKKSNILLVHPLGQLTDLKHPPIMWIDSWNDCGINLPESQAKNFVKCFCEVLGEHLRNPGEVRVAEIVTKTREKMNNTLWRLTFVVNGNPETTLT